MPERAIPAWPSWQPGGPDFRRRALLQLAPVLALALGGCATRPREAPPAIAPFSTAPQFDVLPPGWEDLVLRRDLPQTDYRIERFEGRRVLCARGHGASGARCRVHVDPIASPNLQWSWWTREVPPGMCVASNDTDDSPARVALGFGGDEQRLSARDRALYELVQLITGERLPFATLMYVWDAQLPVGTVVNYARTARIRYLVVESGPARAGTWLRYRRDVVADFRRTFGEDPGPVESVGVMTDGDDLHAELQTYYGDLRLDNDPI